MRLVRTEGDQERPEGEAGVYVTIYPEDVTCKVCLIAFMREQRSVVDDLRAIIQRKRETGLKKVILVEPSDDTPPRRAV